MGYRDEVEAARLQAASLSSELEQVRADAAEAADLRRKLERAERRLARLERSESRGSRSQRVAAALTLVGASGAVGGGVGVLVGLGSAFQAVAGDDPASKVRSLADAISTSLVMSIIAAGGVVVAAIGAVLWFMARRKKVHEG